jgi:mono/diheme cytochrome c family protein
VEGFADIMPAATAAPAKLTYEEVVAAINYLQSLGGKPSAEVGDIPRPAAEAAAPSSEETLTDPTVILTTHRCTRCHSLEPGEVGVGPPLDEASLKKTAADRGMTAEAYIMESIVDPAAFEKEGFPSGVMPNDFGTELTAGQLQALVNHLVSTGGER